MTAPSPNFVLLDSTRPDIANLVVAMLQARDAVERRSWSHPQEPRGEEWWADVLADPRARTRARRTDLAVKQAFYRLADEKRETILVAFFAPSSSPRRENRTGSNQIGGNLRSTQRWNDVPRGTRDEVSSYVRLNLPLCVSGAAHSGASGAWSCGFDRPGRGCGGGPGNFTPSLSRNRT
jgi:hypothetical protein